MLPPYLEVLPEKSLTLLIPRGIFQEWGKTASGLKIQKAGSDFESWLNVRSNILLFFLVVFYVRI